MSLATRSRKWRLTALGGLLLLVAAVASPSFAKPAEAHNGTLYCGTAPFGGNVFQYEYTTWDTHPPVNFHVWLPTWTQDCGPV